MSTENEVLNYSKEERKNHILKEINLHTRVSFETLSAKLGVSEDTVRRDINELDADLLTVAKVCAVLRFLQHLLFQ